MNESQPVPLRFRTVECLRRELAVTCAGPCYTCRDGERYTELKAEIDRRTAQAADGS